METLRRAAGAAAVLAVALVPLAGLPAGDPPPAVVDVDARRPVVAGSLRITVTRRAERLELLLAVSPQNSAERNAAATDALAQRVRAMLPRAGVTTLPQSAIAHRLTRVTGGPYGGFVRVALDGVPDDATVRSAIANINAELVAVGSTFASCDAFARDGTAEATARATAFASALGSEAGPPALRDATRPMHPIDGPANDAPLCGSGAHLSRPAAIARPVSATFALHRTYAFAVPMQSMRVPVSAPDESVPPLWAGPFDAQRFRLRSGEPLLTLEGHARVARRVDGTAYVYEGPAGRYFAGDVNASRLAEMRARLRMLGIPDERIVTEIVPGAARYFVSVHTPNAAFDERIVAAIGGTSEADRRAVRAAPYGPCSASPADVARAVGDAARAAARIAASLGTAADVRRPVAVVLARGAAVGTCIEGANLLAFPEPIARRIAGGLKAGDATRPDADDVTVLATFPIARRALDGAGDAAPATDAEQGYTVRFGFAPPPYSYPDASRSGEARRERRLSPERVRVSLHLLPDNHNTFRPIDPHLGAALAARLGLAERDYAAWSRASTGNLPNGDPEPDGLDFVAVLPYRGDATARDLDAAQRIASGAGYGGLDAVPQRDACAHAAVELSRDTIRAAARDAHAPAGARLVAIDLRGPFTVEGLCRAGAGGPQNWSIRKVVIPDVRLAAYARVSYGP